MIDGFRLASPAWLLRGWGCVALFAWWRSRPGRDAALVFSSTLLLGPPRAVYGGRRVDG